MESAIYIVFSATPYRMGSMIRQITGEPYNHVSVSLAADLSPMYGFARRYYYTPFYGGFVRESAARYHLGTISSQVCICRIPLSDTQYTTLSQQLSQMYETRDIYLYNHLSALATLIRKAIPLKNAYTCTEFCVHLLSDLGFAVTPGQYYTLSDIRQMLGGYIIYTGVMPQTGDDPDFFQRNPVPHPFYVTLRDMLRLLPRLRA